MNPQPHQDAHIQDLNQPGAQDLLATARLVRLAYNGPDGLPRVIPLGFHWDGTAVVVCTLPISPKVPAIAANPQVAPTIDTDGGTASRSLLMRGPAAIEIVDGVPDEYLAASSKGMDGEQARQFEAQVRSMYQQMARILITPQWARYYDFGAGRIPGFLQKLAAAGSNSDI
jgi:hypothetical protein